MAVLVVAGIVAVSCGSEAPIDSGGGGTTASSTASVVPSVEQAEPVQVSLRNDPSADPTIAGSAISELATAIFQAARAESPAKNLTLSPTSIAIALAMVEPGAVGDGHAELAQVLGIDDPAAFHASMNALEQDLEARTPASDDDGKFQLAIANAAYLQDGYPFKEPYLDTIGSNYGPVLNEVDYTSDPDAVAREINDWVADQTEQRITDLMADGALTTSTRLALVNALYMHVSWLQPFDPELTKDAQFTRLDGTHVEAPLMETFSDSTWAGDGWVGATKSYTGDLYAQFILPDEGRFDEIADNVETVFGEYLERPSNTSVLRVPKFESRSKVKLGSPLKALGLRSLFAPGHLMGIADDPRLFISAVPHETFVSFDEEGTEAAAATATIAAVIMARLDPPDVILDRPFLFRIVDRTTGATLFIGQVLDPTA